MALSKTGLAMCSLLLAGGFVSASNGEDWGPGPRWGHWSRPVGWNAWPQGPSHPPGNQPTGAQPSNGPCPSGSGSPQSGVQPTVGPSRNGPGGPGGSPTVGSPTGGPPFASSGWGGWSAMPNSQTWPGGNTQQSDQPTPTPWSATITPMPQSETYGTAQASETSYSPEQTAAASSTQWSDSSEAAPSSVYPITSQLSSSYGSQGSGTPTVMQQSGTGSSSPQTSVNTSPPQDGTTTLVRQSTVTAIQTVQGTNSAELHPATVRHTGHKRREVTGSSTTPPLSSYSIILNSVGTNVAWSGYIPSDVHVQALKDLNCTGQFNGVLAPCNTINSTSVTVIRGSLSGSCSFFGSSQGQGETSGPYVVNMAGVPQGWMAPAITLKPGPDTIETVECGD